MFDPKRFPFAPDTHYVPSGQELGDAEKLRQVFDAYGVRNALVVGPNSGYGTDNRCLLDAIARAEGRFRGMAVVPNEVSRADLARLRDAGILGSPSMPPPSALTTTSTPRICSPCSPSWTCSSTSRVSVTNCRRSLRWSGGRARGSSSTTAVAPIPTPDSTRPRSRPCWPWPGRAYVKLSGYVKFSHEQYPYRDTWPYVRALIDAFGLDACVWASDWPFLRAPERVDYGPLLSLVEHLVPDATDRRMLLWETPRALFGFSA